MPVATETIAVVHDRDPKDVIWDAMSEKVTLFDGGEATLLSCIRPTAGDCVVCVYERPSEIALAGGKKLLTPDNYSRTAEDKFQGVVGLIVKWGPEPNKHRQELGMDEMPKVGTWIAFRTGDCIPFTLGKRSMRLLQGNHIRMILSDPDVII